MFALTTRAREDGDAFVLDGRKLWITNGNEADLFIVFAPLSLATIGGGQTIVADIHRQVVDINHWMTSAKFVR